MNLLDHSLLKIFSLRQYEECIVKLIYFLLQSESQIVEHTSHQGVFFAPPTVWISVLNFKVAIDHFFNQAVLNKVFI